MNKSIIILGGGIAATSCLETLIQKACSSELDCENITLISASRLLKRVVNYGLLGRNIETFDVVEVDPSKIDLGCADRLKFNFVFGQIDYVDSKKKCVIIDCDNKRKDIFQYDILCVCIGSRPRELDLSTTLNPEMRKRFLVIRDSTSIKDLELMLSSSRRVVMVGNGGICLEISYKIRDCQKIWVVRDRYIGHPFLDSEASKFMLDHCNENRSKIPSSKGSNFASTPSNDTGTFGPSLGPYWLEQSELKGSCVTETKLDIIYQCEVDSIIEDQCNKEWPVSLLLTNGQRVDCDLVIYGIGVTASSLTILNGDLKVDEEDNGIIIDEQMRTSIPDIYAAGDVVSCKDWPVKPLWFQMRLWTQARQMGRYCGLCISSHLKKVDALIYNNFECFTHSTKFFGMKVTLIGCYNLQNNEQNDKQLEILVRSRPETDYVKLVLKDSKLIGAILIGDNGLEETMENLINDQLDISAIKNHLLDDIVDIEDYFD